MIKKITTILIRIVFLIGLTASFQASANSGLTLIPEFFSGFDYEQSSKLSPSKAILIKSGEKYDESKDPALRRGTENTEQPQSSFFAIPAVVVGIIGLVLFINRDKS
jgi:hypothetical protein